MSLWRVHVEIEDRPGQLAALAAAVGGAGCNILSLTVLGERGPDGSVTDELLVDAADHHAATELAERIRSAGMGCTLAVRADAGELRDPVTTALALARRVASDPGAGARAVASLLHATLSPPPEGGGHTHELRVFGQDVVLHRAWPFTATELSRAAVLVELAELCARRAEPAEPASDTGSLGLVLLGNGSEVELRVARPTDRPLVAALHARCTPSTRRGRFLNPSPALRPEELSELLVGRAGRGMALLALTVDGGHAVGLASIDPDGGTLGGSAGGPSGEPGTGSGGVLGVLVEDSWQARGVGTALVRRAVELATEAGYEELSASAHPGNLRITRLLRRAGLRPTAQLVDGLLQVHVVLGQPAPVLNR